MEISSLTISEAADLIHRKSLSPVELTESCLDRIEQLNSTINAFITVTAELALKQAREAEAKIKCGEHIGPLHGIPIALKDLIDVAGIRTTAASALFKNRIATEDAEVVRRLKAAGAVIVGKLNLHEFAYGGSGIISAFGVVQNPKAPGHITGGSSSGAAAAVAAGLCLGAIGTDTAGSIRVPAAYCGVVGLKPTYGLVSVRGVVPLSWSYDHVGPITKTVQDAALMLQAIAGYDAGDVDSRPFQISDYSAALEQGTSSLQLGLPQGGFFTDLDPEIASKIADALRVFARFTAGAREIILPMDADRTVASAESYAYHAKFVNDSAELYQAETLRRILSGANVSACAYIYSRRKLEQLRRETSRIFSEIDLIITPTTPVLPPTIAELEADLEHLRQKELLMLRNTRPFNVLGLPTISVPCGTTIKGLPVGLQITGAPGDEAKVLALAKEFEKQVLVSS